MTPPPPSTTSADDGRAAAGDGFRASRHRQDDLPAGLTSLRSIRGALRRRAWLVAAAVVAGLAVGGVLYVGAPPAYQAATSILITNNPDLDPGSQMQDNVALAQSLQVAGLAVRKLGAHQSVPSFARSYTVQALTDQLMQITASASSVGEAERRANVVAQEFMQFRSQVLGNAQQVDLPALRQKIQVVQAQQTKINQQKITALAEPASPERTTFLKTLAKEARTADASLGALNYDVSNYPVLTLSLTRGTAVLDPAAPIPPSRRHIELITGVAGLVAGLALGLGVVLVEAVISFRLRRRRDVAKALGAPIQVTLGKVHKAGYSAWSSGARGGSRGRHAEADRLPAQHRA